MKNKILFVLLVALFAGCSSGNKLFYKSKKNNQTQPQVEQTSWNKEYDSALASKNLIEGMDSGMVEKMMGSPLYKKKKTEDIIIWEYPEKSLYFLQGLLVVWKEK